MLARNIHQRKRLLPIVLILLGMLAFAGCGKKGPLYLPDENPSAQQGPDKITQDKQTQKQKKQQE